MRKQIIKLIGPIIQKGSKSYFSKPRKYRYKQIKGVVLPDVFYPHLTISTKLLLNFIEELDLTQKTFLELGCGTGFISVLAAKNGAKVTALDINPKAIENVQINATRNQVEVNSVLSDLFENIPAQQFDIIVINPPYYPKNPLNKAEEAWFCGENFDYFEKLFHQLPDYYSTHSKVYMILSEDCELNTIQQIALKNNIQFDLVLKKKKWGEENFVFQLKSI